MIDRDTFNVVRNTLARGEGLPGEAKAGVSDNVGKLRFDMDARLCLAERGVYAYPQECEKPM